MASLEDCQGTLEGLVGLMEELEQSLEERDQGRGPATGKVPRIMTILRHINGKVAETQERDWDGELAVLRNQVDAYTRTMGISLQMIGL